MGKHGFWLLVGALTISTLGDTFGLMSLEWLIYDRTGSKLAMGTLALCFGIPEVTLRLLGAPLIDRFDKGRLMAFLACIRFASFGVPVCLGLLGRLELWHLYAAAIVTGGCSALYAPAIIAVVPSLAKSLNLVRAYAIMDGCKNAVLLIGPALAGGLIVLVGSLSVLGVNSICYLMATILTVMLPRLKQLSGAEVNRVHTGVKAYLREMMDGLAFFRQFPAMLVIASLVSITNMSSIAISTMMVPYVQEILHRDAGAMGLIGTSIACGTVVGLFIISLLGDVKKRRMFMLGSLIVIGCLYAAMGMSTNYYLTLLLAVGVGIAGPFFGSFSSALYGYLVPAELSGRVMSARFLVGGALQPLGGFASGFIAHAVGIPFFFVIAGIVPVLFSTAGFMIPLLKELDGEMEQIAAKRRNSPHPHESTPSDVSM